MAAKTPIPGGSAEIPQTTPTVSLPVTPETPSAIISSLQSPQLPSPSPDTDSIFIPSYSRWFSLTEINECETRSLPEFFVSRSSTKSPKFYLYLRNSIIKQYRDDYPRKISFTDVRRTLVSDVVSIRRVFDFLDTWGLINYSTSVSGKPLKWDEKEKSTNDVVSETPIAVKESAKRLCNGCKSVCSIACFACDKYDLTLCARCYVRGNYRIGINSSEFKRVEIVEESKTLWSDKETVMLLEAVMHYGDDWKKVASHVTGRTEKDCVSQFLKLPCGEQFVKDSDSEDALEGIEVDKDGSCPNKRMRLTPLADASNPIMAQAAFLSALAGANVAEAAARAAVTALSDVGNLNQQENNDSERSKTLIEKEEKEVEGAIKEIVEVEMVKIRDRIVHFEELDFEMERSRKQLEEMKNLLFVDQLNIFFHTRKARKGEEDSVEC